MGEFALNPVDKVEIRTLEDNYVDLVSGDNSAIVLSAPDGFSISPQTCKSFS